MSTIAFSASSDRRASTAGKAVRRPSCADHPDDWDLDTGTPEAWRRAAMLCRECPLLQQCRSMADDLIAKGQAPRAMIWAGVGYDNAGKVIPSLERHRVVTVDRRRPTIIVHTGRTHVSRRTASRSQASDSAVVLGRRQIVIRRRSVAEAESA